MANYEIKSYVKLICIRVDHFESYIVDEVNTVSTERIKEFFDKYQEKPELKIIAFQMDGCEVIGAYLAEELAAAGVPNSTHHNSMYVITPEFDNGGQMVVKKNIKDMIKGRNVLVVLASAMSGRTITKAIGTILAYGGHVKGLSVIFGNIQEVDGYPVYSVFSHEDLPNFTLSDPNECPDCKAGKKLDAVVNSYGYETL